MPKLVRTDSGQCGQIFDPPIAHVRGIPLEFYVRPVARMNGVFTDMPKGFELPTCMVDPCCVEEPEVPDPGTP